MSESFSYSVSLLCSVQDSEDEDEYYAMKRNHLAKESDAESQL